MRPSTINIKQNKPGVYASRLEDWQTALSYAIAAPLNNDGVFYQFALELRPHEHEVFHQKRTMGADKVLPASTTRVNGVRVYVQHARQWKPGKYNFHYRRAFDPFLEYRHFNPDKMNKVKIETKGIEGLLPEILE